ncbi:MAG: Uma2 family endonuclease [Cytophagales bacterium]|nr:Uma2 family endonuclease [Cytophagales bacterium]
MITTAQKHYTVEDYRQLEEGDPHQLINGALIALGEPAPTYGHQGIVADILTQIRIFLKDNPIGEVRCAPIDVYFDENNVLQPDIVFVSNQRSDIVRDDGIHGAPDMVIEILSPSTAYYDIKIKKRIYEKYGVQEFWSIDPKDNEVTGFENTNACLPKLQRRQGKFREFYSGYGKFTSKVLKLNISPKL